MLGRATVTSGWMGRKMGWRSGGRGLLSLRGRGWLPECWTRIVKHRLLLSLTHVRSFWLLLKLLLFEFSVHFLKI